MNIPVYKTTDSSEAELAEMEEVGTESTGQAAGSGNSDGEHGLAGAAVVSFCGGTGLQLTPSFSLASARLFLPLSLCYSLLPPGKQLLRLNE